MVGYLLLNFGLATWMYRDGTRRMYSIVPWSIAAIPLGWLVLPVYLAKRPLRDGEVREGGMAWNVLKNFCLFWTVTMFMAAMAGMANTASMPEATSDAVKAGCVIGATIGLGMIFALWFFPLVGAALLGVSLKKSSIVERGPTGPIPPQQDRSGVEPTREMPSTAHGTFSQRARAGVDDLGGKVKLAARLASKQATRANIAMVRLPHAFRALGKRLYAQGQLRRECADHFGAIDGYLRQIESLKAEAANRATPKTAGEKARVIAHSAKEMVDSKAIQGRLNQAFADLGRAAFEAKRGQTTLDPQIDEINDLRSQLASLDAEITSLESIHEGSWITPRRLIFGALAAIGLLALTFLVGKMFRSDDPDEKKQVVSEARTDPASQAPEDEGSSPTAQDDRPATDMEAAGWPPEIAGRQTPTDLPLLNIPIRLSQEKRGTNKVPHFFFSPHGKHAVVVFDGRGKDGQEVQLWDVATGEQRHAKSEACDYFSLPAAFSPDESRIACVDGDFLRVWDLKSNPASLIENLSLTPPSPNVRRKDSWNSLLWSRDDTLILGFRTDDRQFDCIQVLRRTGDRPFTHLGALTRTPSKYKGMGISFGSVTISPDGRFVAQATEPKPEGKYTKYLSVSINAAHSGGEIKEVQFPKVGHAIGRSASASTHLGRQLNPNTSSFHDPGTCLDFSPDGQYLLVEVVADRRRCIKVLKNGTWEVLSQLDLGETGSDDARFPSSFIPSGFSRDGRRFAGIDVSKTRTSRGQKTERVALVFELETGNRIQQIALGDEFTMDDGIGRGDRADQEKAAFSPDGDALVVTVINKDRYSDRNKRPEAAWSVGSWGLADGRKRFVLSGGLLGSVASKSVKLAPDGRVVVTRVGDRLQVWDVPRLAGLRAELNRGDQSWDSGDHTKAFDHYCSVLADGMAWFVEEALPPVYSRCVDTFAERGEVAKGRLLVTMAQRSKIALSPESPQGMKLVGDFEAEKAEARRLESERRRQAEASRLAAVRAKNQSSRVVAGTLTKREFIDRLKGTMYQGRIDGLVTHAIFVDYSFEDVFGEPDANLEWVDYKRLVSYRCRDGFVTLTVMYLDSQVIVSGVNQY